MTGARYIPPVADGFRHRRALIKGRLTIAQGYRFLAELEGMDLAVHICPVCHGPDVSTSALHFVCGLTSPRKAFVGGAVCGAQGDVVTLIAQARQITEVEALGLIEAHLNGEPHD